MFEGGEKVEDEGEAVVVRLVVVVHGPAGGGEDGVQTQVPVLAPVGILDKE